MPVFNATANQVLAKPVDAYYEGKAIRAELKAAEQEAEIRQMEIDNAPSAREAAKQKALLDQENIISQINERYAKGDRDALRYADEVMKPLFQAYGEEQDEDKALEIFNTGLPEAISRLPQAEQEGFIKAAGPDRVFDHEEIMRAGLARRYVEEKEASGDYTLGKGRYSGETNELIAGVAPSEGSTENRSPRWQQAVDGGLTPGTPEFNEYVLNRSGDKLTDRDKRIRDYQVDLGLARDEAVKLADDLFSVKPNPVSGTVQLIDEVGRFVREIDVDRPEVPRPSPKEGETLWDLAIHATGPTNTVASAISIPLAWIGAPTADKVVSARQVFSTTNQDFIRALQNNKRYPMGERAAITEEISMLPKFLDDPKLMRIRMRGLRNSLEVRADQAQRDADDPDQTASFRGGAKQAVSDIRNYLAILGEPTAPEAAIELLKADPSTEAKKEFEDLFGYLPDDI